MTTISINAPGATELIYYAARACHEANRAYCLSLADTSQEHWEDAPEWQRKSAIDGVTNIATGLISRPDQSHESWMAEKERDGWIYGPVKDAEKKQHPCMVPFDQLPPDQKKKDVIFFAVATAFLS